MQGLVYVIEVLGQELAKAHETIERLRAENAQLLASGQFERAAAPPDPGPS